MTANFSGIGYKAWEDAFGSLDKNTTFANLQTMTIRGRKHVEIASDSPDLRLSIRFTGATKGFEELQKMLNTNSSSEDLKNKAIEQFFQEIEEGNVLLEKKEHGKRKAYGSIDLIKKLQDGALQLTGKNGETKKYDEFEEITEDQFKEIAIVAKENMLQAPVVQSEQAGAVEETASDVKEEETVEDPPAAAPTITEEAPSPKEEVEEKPTVVKKESRKAKEEIQEKELQEARDHQEAEVQKEKKIEEKHDDILRHEIKREEAAKEAVQEEEQTPPPPENVT